MATAKATPETARGRRPAPAKRRSANPAPAQRTPAKRKPGNLALGGKARGLDVAQVAIAMDSAEISENFKVESVSNSDLARVAVGAGAQE